MSLILDALRRLRNRSKDEDDRRDEEQRDDREDLPLAPPAEPLRRPSWPDEVPVEPPRPLRDDERTFRDDARDILPRPLAERRPTPRPVRRDRDREDEFQPPLRREPAPPQVKKMKSLPILAGLATVGGIALVIFLLLQLRPAPATSKTNGTPPASQVAATQSAPPQAPSGSETQNQANTTQAVAASDAPQLLCGEGEITPELTQEVIFIIPPGNCWTIWVVKPDGASNFWSAPEGDVWVKKVYADGTESAEILDNPIKRTVDPKPIAERRYRNPGTNPVRVRIQLQ